MNHPVLNSNCKICNKGIYRAKWQVESGVGKFCSRRCYSKYRKGLNTYSGKLDGIRVSKETEFKKGQNKGYKNVNWKGDGAGYHALHKWIYYYFGKPKSCEHCGETKKRMEWANLSYEYKRDRGDYVSLCKKCHIKMDRENGFGLATEKFPEIRRKR